MNQILIKKIRVHNIMKYLFDFSRNNPQKRIKPLGVLLHFLLIIFLHFYSISVFVNILMYTCEFIIRVK